MLKYFARYIFYVRYRNYVILVYSFSILSALFPFQKKFFSSLNLSSSKHIDIFLFIVSFIVFRLRTRCLFNRSEYTPSSYHDPQTRPRETSKKNKLGNGIKKSIIPTRSQFVASRTHVVTRARLHKIARVFAVIWLSPWIWPEVVSRELCERHYDVAWKGIRRKKKKTRKKEGKNKRKRNKQAKESV